MNEKQEQRKSSLPQEKKGMFYDIKAAPLKIFGIE